MLIITNPNDLKSYFLNGAVFAYPTEAVYGLGCDPENEIAVMRLLEIKQRSVSKGLILIASDFTQVETYLKPLNSGQLDFTRPSETTYIYPALESAPKWLTGDFDSLAVRITKHPLVRELCNNLDSALVSTSANLTGEEPAKTANEVASALDALIEVILDGETGDLDKPTQIRDSISGQIIRA
ncbi:MAG: L-threonylcarbamoyladenylate synthase [Cocleimonas sp.]|jgi:L-threonylcarbamoyladenylate synthase